MSLSISPELEARVNTSLKLGRYDSANTMMTAAIGLLDERDIRREALRAKLEASLQALDRGEGTDAEEFFEQMDAEMLESTLADHEAVSRKLTLVA